MWFEKILGLSPQSGFTIDRIHNNTNGNQNYGSGVSYWVGGFEKRVSNDWKRTEWV